MDLCFRFFFFFFLFCCCWFCLLPQQLFRSNHNFVTWHVSTFYLKMHLYIFIKASHDIIIWIKFISSLDRITLLMNIIW
jgi:hypothetical protein